MTEDQQTGYVPTAERLGYRGYARPRPPIGHVALDLVDHARTCLAEAASCSSNNERFAAAHLAALRAGAAVLAARAAPVGRRRGHQPWRRSRGPRSVWELLPGAAPELVEWSAFFAANAGRRAAAQAGLRGVVSSRDADDLVREADTFLDQVCMLLGLPHREPLDSPVVASGALARG